MKLLIKLILGLGILFVLTVGAAVITIAYLDPNDYKATIASKVKEQTGRDLSIDGNISLSYYPWLGLDVEGVSLSNAKGFGEAPFLTTKTIKARAKLLPLLRKELEMDTLVLHGASINLTRNAEGVTNWADLAEPKEQKQQGMPFAALVLGGIDIKDANIVWRDQQQGVEYKINNAKISTGELKLGEPINITAALNASASKPALSSAIQFKGTVAYEEGGDVLVLKPMTLEAMTKGKEIPGGEAQIKLTSEIKVDLDKEIAQINTLDLTAFDTQVNGQIEASDILSGQPSVIGNIDVKGNDLPQLFKIAEIEPLASQLVKLKDKSFDLSISFNVDTARSDIDLNKLNLNVLGNKVDAEIYARNTKSDTPAAKGKLKASGSDLPTLIKIASQFMGDGKQDIKSFSKELSAAPKSFVIETDFDADLKTGAVDIPKLSINALGMQTTAKLNAKQVKSKTPSISGSLKANGPDLPLIMRVAGSLQAKDSALPKLAQDLGKLKDKKFNIDTQFNLDMNSGQVDLPSLDMTALGFKVKGKLKGNNIQKSSGKMDGNFTVNSKNPKPLLTAMGQADVAKVLQSISLNTGISGNTSDLSLKPFSLDAVFSGKKIPNSPVKLTVQADSKINMEKELFELNGLSVTGLGLDIKGTIKASKYKTNPALSGQIAIAPFDLRQFMQSLNKELPKTADPKVLKRVALSSAFSGTKESLSLKDLKAELDDSRLQGDINIKSISPLDLEFGLGLDKLNADRYLPPQTETKPVTPEAVAVGAASGLPVETLRAIKIKGDFVMGQLTVSNAKLSDMELSIRADKGDIKLAPAKAKLYQGNYLGDIHLDATGKLPKLTMNTKLTGVEAEPLLNDVVGVASAKGTANINLAVSSTGADINTLRNTLSGKGDILFEKGTLYGVDVKQVLHDVEIMIENKNFLNPPDPGEKSEFDTLTATLDIHNGIIDNHDLLMLGSGYNVTGKGMLLNLHDETWKYLLVAKADATRVKQGEKAFNIGGHEVPIKCKGKIVEKNCDPVYVEIAKTVVQEAVIDKVLKDSPVKELLKDIKLF